jgi:hypothetical protein
VARTAFPIPFFYGAEAPYVFQTIFLSRKRSVSEEKIGFQVFHLLRDAVRSAVDHSLALGPRLAEFKYTWQIFQPNFLGNEASCEKMLLFLFDLFLRVEYGARATRHVTHERRVSRWNEIHFPRETALNALKAHVARTRAFLCSIRLIEWFSLCLPLGYRFVEIVTGCFTRIYRVEHRSL